MKVIQKFTKVDLVEKCLDFFSIFNMASKTLGI